MSVWVAHCHILIQRHETSPAVDLQRITLSGNINLHELHFEELFFKDTTILQLP
jgi:hypothetical protein